MKTIHRALQGPLLLIITAMFGTACGSAVEMQHLHPGYGAPKSEQIKRIALQAWTPASPAGLAQLTSDIATDFINLKRNHLVYESGPSTEGWSKACSTDSDNKVEGVLEVRILDFENDKDDEEIWLHIAVSFYRCSDAALLWWVDADDWYDTDNEDLAELERVYGKRYGSIADTFATPIFEIIKEALESFPNPELTDDEVMERIEIS